MSKKIYTMIFGKIGTTGKYWLEYHSYITKTIYVNIVQNPENINLFTQINVVAGSLSSYKSMTKLMSIARQGGANYHISDNKIVTELREKLCDNIYIIEQINNIKTKD